MVAEQRCLEHLRRLVPIEIPGLDTEMDQTFPRCAVCWPRRIQQIPSEHPRLISCLRACIDILLSSPQLHLETTSFSLYFFSFFFFLLFLLIPIFGFLIDHWKMLFHVACMPLPVFQMGATDRRNASDYSIKNPRLSIVNLF